MRSREVLPAAITTNWWLRGMVAAFLSPRWGLFVCGFLTHGLRRGLCSVAASRLFSVLLPRLFCRRFAGVLWPASRLLCVAATRLILYRRFRGYSWKVGAAERRKNAAHGASRG